MDELFTYARDQCQEHHQDVGHLFGTFDAAVCLTELIYDRLRTKDFPTSISTSALLSSSSGQINCWKWISKKLWCTCKLCQLATGTKRILSFYSAKLLSGRASFETQKLTSKRALRMDRYRSHYSDQSLMLHPPILVMLWSVFYESIDGCSRILSTCKSCSIRICDSKVTKIDKTLSWLSNVSDARRGRYTDCLQERIVADAHQPLGRSLHSVRKSVMLLYWPVPCDSPECPCGSSG